MTDHLDAMFPGGLSGGLQLDCHFEGAYAGPEGRGFSFPEASSLQPAFRLGSLTLGGNLDPLCGGGGSSAGGPLALPLRAASGCELQLAGELCASQLPPLLPLVGTNLPSLLQSSSLAALASNRQPPPDSELLGHDDPCTGLPELGGSWQLTPSRQLSAARQEAPEDDGSSPLLLCAAPTQRYSFSPLLTKPRAARLADGHAQQSFSALQFQELAGPAVAPVVPSTAAAAAAARSRLEQHAGAAAAAAAAAAAGAPAPAAAAAAAAAVAATLAPRKPGSQERKPQGPGSNSSNRRPPPGAPAVPPAPVPAARPKKKAAAAGEKRGSKAGSSGGGGSGESGGGGGVGGGGAGLTSKQLTVSFLEEGGYFNMPLQQASELLGIGVTTLKKACRKQGVTRWPFRKRSSLDRLISKTEEYFAADPQQSREALQKLEAERAALKSNADADIAAAVKRYRQSIFKLDFKVRKMAGGEKAEGTNGSEALSELCANSCKYSMRHLAAQGSAP